jgi:hypothetical protein
LVPVNTIYHYIVTSTRVHKWQNTRKNSIRLLLKICITVLVQVLPVYYILFIPANSCVTNIFSCRYMAYLVLYNILSEGRRDMYVISSFLNAVIYYTSIPGVYYTGSLLYSTTGSTGFICKASSFYSFYMYTGI